MDASASARVGLLQTAAAAAVPRFSRGGAERDFHSGIGQARLDEFGHAIDMVRKEVGFPLVHPEMTHGDDHSGG